jgi:hypothetical protein
MSIKLELNGIVYQIAEPTTRKDYQNQDMILHIPDVEKDQYSDFFKIEWNDKGIKTLQEQKIQAGDEVKVVAYLNGNKWTDKEGADRAFNAIKGYAIEKAEKENSADQELTPFPILDTPEKETKDDLPF